MAQRGNGYGREEYRPRQGARRGGGRKRGRASKAKWIIFVVEIVIMLGILGVLAVLFLNQGQGPTVVELKEEELGKTENEQAVEEMKGYWNIALFGVDAENEKQLQKGARSDSMMIASINLDNGDIKLVSIYRDTYLNVGNGEYRKANHAYAVGGGAQALKMLNTNMDLEISDFITIGYEGLREVVDGLGGVEIDVDSEEIKHINNYQYSIAKVLDDVKYTEVTRTGMQTLDGMQAAAYCRIRYTAGDDFKRAERQREVVKAIEAKAKKADLVTLTSVFEKVMKHVHTSLKAEVILPYLSKVAEFRIVDEGGFPEAQLRAVGNIGSTGSSVIPVHLTDNARWLHQFLFGNDGYTPSTTVEEYSEKIRSKTSQYLQK